MHYKNGTPAKVGDQVIGKDGMGRIVAGTLIAVSEGSTSCNGNVMPANEIYKQPTITIGEFLRADEALLPLS